MSQLVEACIGRWVAGARTRLWLLGRLSVAVAVSFAGCNATNPGITESRAKELALERYRQLFSDKFYLNRLDGKHYALPELGSNANATVETRADTFVVHVEPPAGIVLEARVSKDGKWTELVHVSFVTE